MQCQQCHKLNDDDSNFCEQCGQPLQIAKQTQTNGLLKLAAGVGIAALAAWQLSRRQKSSPQQASSKNSTPSTGRVMTCENCGHTGPTRVEKSMTHISTRKATAFYMGAVSLYCSRCGTLLYFAK